MLLPVAAVVAFVLGALANADQSVSAAAGVLAGTVVLLGLTWVAVRSESIVLEAVSATTLPPAEAPDLVDTVAATARRLRIAPPRLAISRTSTPFALIAGRGRSKTTLCVSSGLLADLDADGLLTVVTHQLTYAASPVVGPRTVASAWAARLLAATDSSALSLFNPVGVLARRLGVTAAQQTEVDAHTARSMVDFDALPRLLARLDARIGRHPLPPTGPLVAVAGLMTTSPFGNDIRAAQLAGQPDTRARLLLLEQSATRGLGQSQR